MSTLTDRIPFLGYQLIGWLLWGAVLWAYMHKAVAPHAFNGVGDWAIMMGIHIATANLTAFLVGPCVTAHCQNHRYIRAILTGMLFLAGIMVFAIGLSIAVQAMTFSIGEHAPPEPEVVNTWQTLLVLFVGVILGSLYYAALWLRQATRLDKIQYEALERELQSAIDEQTLERLNGQLVPHLINNLMDTLNYTVKWRPHKVPFMVYAITEFTKAYGRFGRHSLIPLADELALLELYIDVIRIRLGYAPHIKIDAATTNGRVRCIPMLLVLLAENMKKYAVLNDSGQPAVISVRVNGRRLTVHTSNRKSHARAVYSTHTGLQNLSERLRLLWGEDACMKVSGRAETSELFSVDICCHTELFA